MTIEKTEPVRADRMRLIGTVALLVAVLLAVVTVAAYRLGSSHAEKHFGTRSLVGSGFVGADQASLKAGGTWYRFTGDVAWSDAEGGLHDGTWPACLPHLTEVRSVRFAGVLTHLPDGSGTAEIVWIDCRS